MEQPTTAIRKSDEDLTKRDDLLWFTLKLLEYKEQAGFWMTEDYELWKIEGDICKIFRFNTFEDYHAEYFELKGENSSP